MIEDIFTTNINEVIETLLIWWKFNKRNFPWRNTNDSYIITCVEILLQRTKAEAVERVYDEFFSSFPNIYHLSTDNSEILKNIIYPLGLPKRVNILRGVANYIIETHGGRIPNNESDLLAIPGIGEYTAHAILSFSYGENYSVFDTNTSRIVSRIFGVHRANKTEKKFREVIYSILNKMIEHIGSSVETNYSLLDFAAIICRKKKPQCQNCPLSKNCYYNLQVSPNS